MDEATLTRGVRIEERSELERWTAADDEDRGRRARIILMAAEGQGIRQIADACGSHAANVKKWIKRFNEKGVSGLDELKRGPKKGTRARFSEEQERAIVDLSRESPRDIGLEFENWSPQKLADVAMARGLVEKISHVTVRQMLRNHELPEPSTEVGDTERAQAVVVHDAPANVIALMDAGQAALEAHDDRDAAGRFSEALAVPDLAPATEATIRCGLAQALEGLARYDEALDAIRQYDESAVLATFPPPVRGLVKVRLGWVYSWLRKYPRAIARLNEAIKIYRETEDSAGLAEGHYALGRTYMEIAESSMARDHLQRAIELQRYTTNRDFLAQVYVRLGTVEFNEGDIAKATEFSMRARELAEGSRDDALLGRIYVHLGVMRIHADRGERDLAARDLERAVFHLERCGHRPLLSVAYNSLGDNLRFAGEWARALEVLDKAFVLARDVGDTRAKADALITAGEIAVRQGRHDEAQQKIVEALELLRTIDDRWGEAYALRVLGTIYHVTAHRSLALQTVREALHLATVIKDLRGVTASHLILAELNIAEGRYEQAAEYIELARGALKADPSQLRSTGIAQRLSGRLELVRGRFAEAQQQIAQSISIFTAVADPYEVGLSHLEMGDLLAQSGDTVQARVHVDQAVEILQKLGAEPDLVRAADVLRARAGRTSPAVASSATAAAAAFDHRASDVLLMQRLIDASASRELLLQELVSVVEENFDPGRVLLLAQASGGDVVPDLAHGYAPAEAEALAREINWSLASDERTQSGKLFALDDRGGARVLLHVERPVPSDRLRPLMRQAELGLENCALRDLSRRSAEPDASRQRVEAVIPGFILAGAAMREVIERIHKIRTSDVTVLITGESGTGKELVARAIHAESERRRAVFLPFNCTATPKEIIDSQLFGHRRGSFTGATSNYPGIIRAAESGTLFLDEIGDLALEVQPKLLRFLESGEIQPLGEARPTKVDVRVVAATNNDLERAVEEGRFREDLFHRLNIIRIHVPPLRERREEIPALADYFLKHFAERGGKQSLALSADAMSSLTSYVWPGNVRQLRNEMERVVAYSGPGSRIASTDLSPELGAGFSGRVIGRAASLAGAYDLKADSAPGTHSLKEATDLYEKRLIEEALRRAGNSLTGAATELGLSTRGLHLKMSQLGIARPRQAT